MAATCPWLLIPVASVRTTPPGWLTNEFKSVMPTPLGPVIKAC